MKVPLIDVKAQNAPLAEELGEAFARVRDSGWYILGPELDEFESAMARRLGVKHVVGVSSGTDALLLAFMALDLGPGDEVLCPAFTFFATAGCVARTGATPVFTDVCPVCFNMDSDSARERVTPQTRAMVPVHLFGQSADMDSLQKVAGDHGLAVVEDAAQAIGARYKGTACGAIGQFGAFSFFPTKNLGGFGDAGMLATNDDDLAERARILRVHGMNPKYYHPEIGANFRMDALQAALLGVKASRLDHYNQCRAENAAYYTEQLSGLPGVATADEKDCCCPERREAGGGDVPRLILPVAYGHNDHCWNQYTLRVTGDGQREALRAHLAAAGVGCEVYYPMPLHHQACFRDLPERARGSLPVSERLAGEVLSIPIFPELTRGQQDLVIAGIRSFLD
ncbi:MAG: DegT/DnrJ/EryC1/StrS family aminotransferase [Akkermansiaceae bacterium]|nr:DegT/DnrJ/EryC1/StrS family aminotransferase [Akkermansiaceae bacterium]NNM28867.1 DegT/DnrJ/EryC1/StrS family aminotransferase [Akkermansiaceae bacterium]